MRVLLLVCRVLRRFELGKDCNAPVLAARAVETLLRCFGDGRVAGVLCEAEQEALLVDILDYTAAVLNGNNIPVAGLDES